MGPLRDSGETFWWWIGAALAMTAFVGGGGAYLAQSRVEDPAPVVAAFAPVGLVAGAGELILEESAQRSIEVYEGYGAWVDVFDYDPAYGRPTPTITVSDLAEMAADGVATVFLQAARLDERTPGGLVDPWLLAEFVLAAHANDLAVVGWYLPRFGEGSEDRDRVAAVHEFEVLHERFDGIALDIEWIGDGIEPETRSARLLDLTDAARVLVGDDPLGAITPPPVQTEVINPDFWPGFPWRELSGGYDVWLPMSYWSVRSDASGYGEGYRYHEESVRRLRANLGDEEALIHGIGGIGGVDGIDDAEDPEEPLATVDEIGRFLEALVDTSSIGGSIYDWATLEPAARKVLRDHFSG